jgi:glycosyltransferase involved in cell wall biosynthesis
MRSAERRKSIIMLVPGFPANEAETDCLPPVQNFVKAVASRNPDVAVHVVSFHYPFRRGRYVWNGAMVHALAGRNKRFPMRLWSWLQAAGRVRQLIKSHQVIALHSFWLAECTYVAAWLARLTATKHIATICGQDALSENPYLKWLQLDKMTTTAGSEGAAEAFRDSTGRHVDYIIPTGLDSQALAAHQETSARSIDILGVGSLSPIKEFNSFLEVIAVLAADHTGLRCVIIGDGPERPMLEQKINEAGLLNIVRLAGHISREEVLSTMRQARILLHPAGYEGQGYVFLEALASGMRVVCRDVGYTGNGAGAYRCKSTAEILDVLRMLLSSPLENQEVSVESIDCTARSFEKLYGIDPL